MTLSIRAELDYDFAVPTDVLLHLEAAIIPEQIVTNAWIDISPVEHFARVPAQSLIGERIWLRVNGSLRVSYRATVEVQRVLSDCLALPMVPPHQLPGETIEYLMPSRYCQSDRMDSLAMTEFSGLQGGAQVIAIRDWVRNHLSYVPGSSSSATTAIDTYVDRQGVCRDYAHLVITLVRACGMPARMVSVYALGVEPPDFHAVAEVFVGGEWHLIDATGMATEADMAKIGVGRDAADVSFLSAFGIATMNSQSVSVERV
jgi:transglutaminase-like putative cysteine protease